MCGAEAPEAKRARNEKAQHPNESNENPQEVDAKSASKENSEKLFGCPECRSDYESLKEAARHVLVAHGKLHTK